MLNLQTTDLFILKWDTLKPLYSSVLKLDGNLVPVSILWLNCSIDWLSGLTSIGNCPIVNRKFDSGFKYLIASSISDCGQIVGDWKACYLSVQYFSKYHRFKWPKDVLRGFNIIWASDQSSQFIYIHWMASGYENEMH